MIVRMERPRLEGTDDVENTDVITKTGDTSRVEVDIARQTVNVCAVLSFLLACVPSANATPKTTRYTHLKLNGKRADNFGLSAVCGPDVLSLRGAEDSHSFDRVVRGGEVDRGVHDDGGAEVLQPLPAFLLHCALTAMRGRCYDRGHGEDAAAESLPVWHGWKM
jgi:hypothetical protein